MSRGYDLRISGRANRVKSAMLPVVVASSVKSPLFLAPEWLFWFSRMHAIRANFLAEISLHFLSTGDHLPTRALFLLSIMSFCSRMSILCVSFGLVSIC